MLEGGWSKSPSCATRGFRFILRTWTSSIASSRRCSSSSGTFQTGSRARARSATAPAPILAPILAPIPQVAARRGAVANPWSAVSHTEHAPRERPRLAARSRLAWARGTRFRRPGESRRHGPSVPLRPIGRPPPGPAIGHANACSVPTLRNPSTDLPEPFLLFLGATRATRSSVPTRPNDPNHERITS